MNKKYLIPTLVLITALALSAYYASRQSAPEQGLSDTQGSFGTVEQIFKNATFTVNGETVTLKNGIAEQEAIPGSLSKITTTYFGNTATGDLNFDGLPDGAFLITQEGGGSGVFFYVVAAIKTNTGYKMTNAFFIGDRIAPQNTEIISNELHVNFAERRPEESMTTPPSQGAVLLLKVTPDNVLEGLMK